MAKKIFNLSDWLPGEQTISVVSNSERVFELESIITQLEFSHTDLTANYSDWLNIGFAFAGEFGEAGRDYFHRVSRFYPGYSLTGCNKQYDACLKSNKSGISLGTFFYLANKAGIDILRMKNYTKRQFSEANLDEFHEGGNVDKADKDEPEPEESLFNTPRLAETIYERLPSLLSESVDLFGDAIEKDVFLIGALAVISGCLPNIRGIYFDEPYSAHLYAFITAPAGSGKGKMKWARYLGQTIHEHLIETSKAEYDAYAMELEQYNNFVPKERKGHEKPVEPRQRMFFIPANSSSSAFIQALADNEFTGVIFETEADTLSGTFKQEWGNFSDVLRKAFHHERTSLFRRKDREFIDIKDPHLAIALSGTPRQVQNMMPDSENGLFSRFLYYAFEDNGGFKNPFVSHRQIDYISFFQEQGKRIFELYLQLNALPRPLLFSLTPEQGSHFTEEFDSMLKRSKLLLGNDLEANIKRLGLITFRIAMTLTALRILDDGDLSGPLICSDQDFAIALSIASTLEKHAVTVYKNLSMVFNPERVGMKGTALKFFEALPEQFDRQVYLKVASGLGIAERNADKYIRKFKPRLLTHEKHLYTKLE